MRRIILGVAVVAVVFAICSNPASAYFIDGNVDDWGITLSAATSAGYLDSNLPYGGLDIDVVTEDNADNNPTWQRVYPGWSWYNYFDAEAMYFDNDSTYAYIAIITGLPQLGINPPGNSVSPGGDAHIFKPGDIGIDVDGLNGYEFGLRVSDGLLFNVDTSINNGTIKDGWNKAVYTWSDLYYNPSTINSVIGSGMGAGDGVEFIYKEGPNTGLYNTHYVLESRIPLSLLGLDADWGEPAKSLNLHWGMECGNDYMYNQVDVNPVPEPATMALLGLGIAGVAVLKRRRTRV